MFFGRVKTPDVGGLFPAYQVFHQEKGSNSTFVLPVSPVSRDSELSTCPQFYLLVVCSCTFYACKWTTAMILSIWAHCLPTGWLERLAFLHLPLQQESCLLPVSTFPDSDDYLPFLPSLLLLSYERQSSGEMVYLFPPLLDF